MSAIAKVLIITSPDGKQVRLEFSTEEWADIQRRADAAGMGAEAFCSRALHAGLKAEVKRLSTRGRHIGKPS